MGGEGAMMAMITSLKNNSRRGKRNQFDKKKLGGFGTREAVRFDFPEVTPEVLRTIRDRLQEERRRTMTIRLILFFIIVNLLIIFIIT